MTPLTHLVVDSGFFISGTALPSSCPQHCLLLTTPSVKGELKDVNSRQRFHSSEWKIQERCPSVEIVKKIERFIERAGERVHLSRTDIDVIALTYQVEVEVNGGINVCDEPQRIEEGVVRGLAGKSMSGQTMEMTIIDDNDEDKNEEKGVDKEGMNDDEKERNGKLKEGIEGGKEKVREEEEEEEKEGDEEIEWITADNVNERRELDRPSPTELEPVSRSSVACMTGDFAMQNVLLQMGLRLIGVNGKMVTSIRQWLKKCHACFTLTRDLNGEFCSACGHHTLIRVTILSQRHLNGTVSVRLFHGTRHLNLHGTRYSIPTPKGGRNGHALRLTEDVMPSFMRRKASKNNSSAHLFDSAIEFGTSAHVTRRQQEDVFGFGRRNPNEPKRRTDKLKKCQVHEMQ